MRQYLDLMAHVRHAGIRKQDRTGTGTLSVFGYQMRFDLSADFPLLTTKSCISNPLFMSCYGFSPATPMSPI